VHAVTPVLVCVFSLNTVKVFIVFIYTEHDKMSHKQEVDGHAVFTATTGSDPV